MKAPFLDGSEGQWMTHPKEVKDVMMHYWKANFQIHLHTNGDKAQWAQITKKFYYKKFILGLESHQKN